MSIQNEREKCKFMCLQHHVKVGYDLSNVKKKKNTKSIPSLSSFKITVAK